MRELSPSPAGAAAFRSASAQRYTEAMLDERRHVRHRPVLYLKVFDPASGALVGHLVDISERGLMLVTEEPLDKGLKMELAFTPPEESGAREPVSFQAEVRWCRPEANPELHDLGLIVIDPSPAFRHAVQQLTSGYVFSGST
ncbi:MAG: PilZ domain-containing protein [Wenzhouxiangella sp.]|nr:PilZ domain-containing protein [Wenzhouxiangella sp.]